MLKHGINGRLGCGLPLSCPATARQLGGANSSLACSLLHLCLAALEPSISWSMRADLYPLLVRSVPPAGYLYCNMPQLTFTQGEKVRFHILALGTEGA